MYCERCGEKMKVRYSRLIMAGSVRWRVHKCQTLDCEQEVRTFEARADTPKEEIARVMMAARRAGHQAEFVTYKNFIKGKGKLPRL